MDGVKYAIRYDYLSDENTRKFTNYLRGNTRAFILFSEIGSRTQKLHYQGYVVLGESVNLKSFRTAIKRLQNAEYNNAYSVSVIKDVKLYESYMSKDKNLFDSNNIDYKELNRILSLEYSIKNNKELILRYIDYMRQKVPIIDRYSSVSVVSETISFLKSINKLFDILVIKRFIYFYSVENENFRNNLILEIVYSLPNPPDEWKKKLY